MQFALKEQLLAEACDTLILGVYESGDFPATTAAVDAMLQGALKAFLSLKDFIPKTGATTTFYPPQGKNIARIILVGLGKAEALDGLAYQKIMRGAGAALQKKSAQKIACFLSEITVLEHNDYWKVRQAIDTIAHATYSFKSFKGKTTDEEQPAEPASLDEAQVFFPKTGIAQASLPLAIKHGEAIAQAVKLVRDLGNTPPNICSPEYLAEQAVSQCHGLPHTRVEILSEAEMARLEMGAFLAVTKGSDNPAQLVVIHYQGGNKHDKPIALVGKGISFDTGGLSLKNSQAMVGMKFDMCGAASVLAAIQLAARLALPINIVALMACAENMPSGHATRPDDIVTTMSGKTVEIGNTDAEGRLVLCDTLTYAQKTFAPHTLVDVATLTGAVIVALGRHASGLFSNQQPLANELIAAGLNSLDRVWQMPLWEEYQSQLDSPFADMNNSGGPEAGSVSAACFLSRFIEKETAWAHLDVAGSAFVTGKDAHATGRPASLLAAFLLARAQVVPQ